MIPAVRRSSHGAHARAIAVASSAYRGAVDARRLTMAHATSARHRPGTVDTYSNMPWPAPAIDTCASRLVTITATTITTMAAIRSIHGARLKNSHHTRSTRPPTGPASALTRPLFGAMTGSTSHSSHWTTTMTTPGHRRKGFTTRSPSRVLIERVRRSPFVSLLRAQSLQYVDARRAHRRHQRGDDRRGAHHDRSAGDRHDARQLHALDEPGRDARQHVAAGGSGGDPDRG